MVLRVNPLDPGVSVRSLNATVYEPVVVLVSCLAEINPPLIGSSPPMGLDSLRFLGDIFLEATDPVVIHGVVVIHGSPHMAFNHAFPERACKSRRPQLMKRHHVMVDQDEGTATSI